MNSLIKNSIALILMQGVNYIIPLITLPYLTRALGVSQYGALNTALNIILYMILFVDFGFNLSATREIAKNKLNYKYINNIYWNVIASKISISIFIISIFLLAVFQIEKYNDIKYTILFMIPQIIGSIMFPLWLYQGIEKIYLVSIISTFSKLLTIPLFIIFVNTPEDLNTAAIIQSLPLLISGITSTIILIKWKAITPPILKNIKIKSTIYDSLPIFLGSAAISLYTLCTPIILSLMSNFTEVGYYVAADKLRSAILGIFLILGQVIYPRVNILLQNNINEYYKFIRKLIIIQLMLSTIAMITFYFIMPLLAPFILGGEFYNLGIIIKIMSPMIILIPSSVILANCILLPMGKNKLYAIIPSITAVIHLPYTLVLSKYYGALGSSISILLTEIISFLLLFLACYKLSYLKRVISHNE
ncbi:oligosaccharide flippase family protein [Xenorhabdus bovienii]|uniref:oligosaccharide flippase family protein n=1 Tax=Xenorhabdus bovienii TaxID=40576 RepID=UPI0023B2789E|nr:oligosaccharide flippase family protein [Xenorhabdus bovienii]MDE9563765.1 oligosaccharide flippase family protein [Xenorhabdus bovienii]